MHVRFYMRTAALERSSESQIVRLRAQEADHIRDVLVERNPQRRRALDDVLALHAARERLVLHPLLHRAGLEIEHALARPHVGGGRDEARELVAGEERLLEP